MTLTFFLPFLSSSALRCALCLCVCARRYHLYGASRRKHPTGGYSRPLNIIASKLCTRVDLYGFGSRNSSGKYFKKSAKVRPAHIMSFEHWTFRYMMSRGKLCVYGE